MFIERFDAGIQVDFVPFAFVDPGEESQVFDDPLDAPQAFAGSLDQLGEVVQGIVQVELLRSPDRSGRGSRVPGDRRTSSGSR